MLEAVATAHGKTIAQAAIAWTLQVPASRADRGRA